MTYFFYFARCRRSATSLQEANRTGKKDVRGKTFLLQDGQLVFHMFHFVDFNKTADVISIYYS